MKLTCNCNDRNRNKTRSAWLEISSKLLALILFFRKRIRRLIYAQNCASFRSGETRLAWLGHFLIPLPALIFQFDVLDRDRVSVEVGKYFPRAREEPRGLNPRGRVNATLPHDTRMSLETKTAAKG